MVELIGGGWDIQWHIAHVPEFFWTPPHIVLYSGAGLVLLSTAGAFLLPWAGRPLAGPLPAPHDPAAARAPLPLPPGGPRTPGRPAVAPGRPLRPPPPPLT